MRTPLLATIGTVVVLALAPAFPAAARVDQTPSLRRTADPEGDVFSISYPGGDETIVRHPKRRLGDITGFRVRHREHAVVTRVRMASYRRVDTFHIVAVQLRAATGTFTVLVYADDSTPQGEVYFSKGEDERSCRRLTHRLAYARDLATIRVPRTCLGTPAWVRARGVVAYAMPHGGDSDFYLDGVPGSKVDDDPASFGRRAWWPGR